MMRPLVTLHFAQSLDGRIGLGPERERALLSSEEGVLCAHQARAEHDAVLVGIDTVLHDDPRLTARAGSSAQPLRVVLDSALRLPRGARLLTDAEPAGQVLVFCAAERTTVASRAALSRAGADVQALSADGDGRVPLAEVLDALGRRGVRRLLVEGGAKVLTSFLLARAAHRAEIELSLCFMGAPATPALRELGVERLAQALRLEQVEVERLGPSVLLRGAIRYPDGPEA
jgi:riboflavin-specific deaminase-like protein